MVVKVHMLLHEIMDSAVGVRLIPRNPTEGAKLPKTAPAPKTILSVEQLKRFMSAIREDTMWHDFFYTAMTTGLRKGEMCGLKWCDLDEDSGKLTVRRSVRVIAGGELDVGETKTERGTRTILLPPGTLELLKERRKSSVSEWMFPDFFDPEKPISPNAAYGRLKKILSSAGLPDMRFHDIRHTFATTSLEHGMDIKTLSAIIGHVRSATTINIYSHITDTMQIHAANRIEKAIGDGESAKAYPTPTESIAETEPPQRFTPYMGKIRKSGTGGIYQINDHLYEGRYTPTNAQGKREVHTVYAKTREEVEPMLEKMIGEVREKIKLEKESKKYTA